MRQRFTSKERDGETGLDYFLARYYSSQIGRFTSPDEFNSGPVEVFSGAASANPTFYSDLTNPQSLNKYQYCLSNPLRYIDPYGHQTQDGKDGGGLTEWFRSLVRRFLAQTKPEEAAKQEDEERAASPIPGYTDGDKLTEQYVQKVGEGMERAYDTLEITGLDMGSVSLMRSLIKNDGKAAAVGAIFFVGNVASLGKGKGAVLIGENMAERVIPVAEAIGAKVYNPRALSNLLRNNARWIMSQISKGSRIFDLGPMGSEAAREAYLKEVELLISKGYKQIEHGKVTVNDTVYTLYEWVKK